MKIRKKETNGWIIGGFFGLLGGFVCPLLGVLILMAAENHTNLPEPVRKFADTMTLLTIPLLILGSFCLNKSMDEPKQKID